MSAAATAKSLQSCPTLCDPIDGSPPGSLSPGFSRQEHWSGLPFPSPMHESEKKWSHSVMSDSLRPHGCSLPCSSVHGIYQAGVLEWGAVFSVLACECPVSARLLKSCSFSIGLSLLLSKISWFNCVSVSGLGILVHGSLCLSGGFLVCLALFLPVPHCLDFWSFKVSLRVG